MFTYQYPFICTSAVGHRHQYCVAMLLAGVVAFSGCKRDDLGQETARLQASADAPPGQLALSGPVGLDLGELGLKGERRARFNLEMVGFGVLDITGLRLEDAEGASFSTELSIERARITDFPVRMLPGQTGALTVIVRNALADQLPVKVRAVFNTESATVGTRNPEVRVQAIGKFYGEANLQVSYNSRVYSLPEDCDFSADGVCTLPVFDIGAIAVGTCLTSDLTLLNTPAAGECFLPDVADGVADCGLVCLSTIDRNTSWQGVGIGVRPAAPQGKSCEEAGGNGQFRLRDYTFPFHIAPAKQGCSGTNSTARGQSPVPIVFKGLIEPGDTAGELFLETDDAAAPRVRVPLAVRSAKPPVAVAAIRECGVTVDGHPINAPPNCSNADSLRPYTVVYLDGRESYDTDGSTDLAKYEWELIDSPEGAGFDELAFQFEGQGTSLFNMFVPIAGTYKVRLTVTDRVNGVRSVADGTTEVVTFTVVPESLLHLQLVWDHSESDVDLHLVYLKDGTNATDLVFHGEFDCTWSQCLPGCQPDCDPPHWFPADPVFTGGNPRLDVDDKNGYGPENINITAPRDGIYRLYVHNYGVTNNVVDPSTATVRVFGNGILQAEYRRRLQRDDLWAVAELQWKDGALTVRQATADGESVVGSVVRVLRIPSIDEGLSFIPNPF